MGEPVQEIARVLLEKKRVAVAGHSRPDGDSIGSALALALALRAAGKEVDVLASDPTPASYRKLPGADTIRVCQTAEGDYDAVVILECNSVLRTGIDGFEKYFVINIDHHTSGKSFGQLNWIDVSFGAVGQLVFRLIEAMGLRVTPDVAANLYVALVTDTGKFQFANTTAVEFDDARRLVEFGAQPAEISEQVYRSESAPKIRLLAAVLSTFEMDESQRIAWMHVTPQMFEQAGAAPSDTEDIVNLLLNIETVRLAAFFKQESDKSFRLSLRSKDNLDVSRIAQIYDGGGHRNAAGFTVRAGFEEAKHQVLERLRALLNGRPLAE